MRILCIKNYSYRPNPTVHVIICNSMLKAGGKKGEKKKRKDEMFAYELLSSGNFSHFSIRICLFVQILWSMAAAKNARMIPKIAISSRSISIVYVIVVYFCFFRLLYFSLFASLFFLHEQAFFRFPVYPLLFSFLFF